MNQFDINEEKRNDSIVLLLSSLEGPHGTV
jgi:hypothetical protein